jgi:hypothetical protein
MSPPCGAMAIEPPAVVGQPLDQLPGGLGCGV